MAIAGETLSDARVASEGPALRENRAPRSLLLNTSKYETRSLLMELRDNGMYLGNAIINDALQQAGEID